ncbi:MAG: hypothetical protein ABI351_09150 [Herbaspirillum sp.]
MSNLKQAVKLPKKARGSRPYFFEDTAVDKVIAMVMGLAGEVSVMADRVDTLERLLAEKGTLDLAQIEAYRPSVAVSDVRDSRRDMMLSNVMRIILQNEGDPDNGEPNDTEYMAVIKEAEQA